MSALLTPPRSRPGVGAPGRRPSASSPERHGGGSEPARRPRRPALVLAVAAAGAGLAFVDATIVDVAFRLLRVGAQQRDVPDDRLAVVVLEAGLALTPGPFVAAAVARPASRLAARVGYAPVLGRRHARVVLGVALLVGTPARAELLAAFDRGWLFAAACIGATTLGSLLLGRVRPGGG